MLEFDLVRSNKKYIIRNCYSDESTVIIPEKIDGHKIESIDLYAFNECENLECVKFSKFIDEITYNAFVGCKKLKNIIVDDNDNYIFEDGVLFNKDKSMLIAYLNCKTDEKYIVPKTVKVIAKEAFDQNEHLKEVILPESMEGISDEAFLFCSELQKICLPKHIEYISRNAFEYTKYYENKNNWEGNYLYCDNYLMAFNDEIEKTTDFKIKEGTEFICADIIKHYNKVSADNLYLPSSIKGIFGSPLNKTLRFKNLYFSGTIEDWCNIKFEESLFYFGPCENIYFNNTKIEDELIIPETITEIGDNAFCHFNQIQKISLSKNLKKIGFSAFFGCELIEEVDIPDSVTDIGEYAFASCSNLKSVKFGNGIKAIPDGCFRYCSLKNITLPNGIEEIGSEAFKGGGFNEISIPFSLEKLGNHIVEGCTKLKKINIPAKVMQVKMGEYSNYYGSYTSEFDAIRDCGKKGKVDFNFMFEDGHNMLVKNVDTKSTDSNNLLHLILGYEINEYEYNFDLIKKKEIRYPIILHMALVCENKYFLKCLKNARKNIFEYVASNGFDDYAKMIMDSPIFTDKQKEEFAVSVQDSNDSELLKVLEKANVSINSATERIKLPKNLKLGDRVKFGRYHILNDTGMQPIEWKVISASSGVFTLISEYCLDCMSYNDKEDFVWKNTTLRKWLNDDFYNLAFSDAEKELIQESHFYQNGRGNSNDSESIDKVSLLDIFEFQDMIKNSYPRLKKGKLTPYAIDKCKNDKKGVIDWWLRHHCINKKGEYKQTSFFKVKYGVRPVILIKLK